MVFCILQPIAHKGATMVEFVHLPIHVLAQQDGLVQIATQVSAYICIYITILGGITLVTEFIRYMAVL